MNVFSYKFNLNNENRLKSYLSNYDVAFETQQYAIFAAKCSKFKAVFYQSGKFAITGDVVILKLKEGKTLDLKLFSVLVTYFLTKKYDWSNKLVNKKLTEEIIYYPIVEFIE